MMPGTPPLNHEFAAFIKRLLGGRSLREVARETGISHTRISDMLFGVVPTYKLLARFADALCLEPIDRRDLFRAAGYGQNEMSQPLDEQELLERALEIVNQIQPTPEELAELEGVELMGYHGPQASPHDLDLIKRLLVARNRLRKQAEGRE
jgi:transcriptional regulator with XRE-family HTH domain